MYFPSSALSGKHHTLRTKLLICVYIIWILLRVSQVIIINEILRVFLFFRRIHARLLSVEILGIFVRSQNI